MDISLHNIPNLTELSWNSDPSNSYEELSYIMNNSNLMVFEYNGLLDLNLSSIPLPVNIVSWDGGDLTMRSHSEENLIH